MYTVKNEFICPTGKIIEIRNLVFDNFDIGKTGLKYVCSSHSNSNFKSDARFKESMMIFKFNDNPSRGARIYEECHNFGFIGGDDYRFLPKLIEKQKDVNLTEFPTGIITLNNKIIGQEIPYYDGYVSMGMLFKNNQNNQVATYYYLKVLKILRELLQNGVVYYDIHAGNFLINPLNNDVKLIDFESSYLDFCNSKNALKNMLNNLKTMLVKLNSIKNISVGDSFNKISLLDEMEDYISELHYKLIKK